MIQSQEIHKNNDKILNSVSQIAAAYLSNPNNVIDKHSIADIVQIAYSAVVSIEKGINRRNLNQSPISVDDSVTPEYIVCLEDGKKLKMLKRHLRTAYGLTPDAYKQRWNLPVDYPMVAPNYAKKRSSLAKMNELGRARSRVYRHPIASSM